MVNVRIMMYVTLVLCGIDILAAQGGSNVVYVGQMKTRGSNGYSQIWGYNGPNGKEYAILGCLNGTQIVDITSDTLKEVAFIAGPQSGWREMKVYQHYAYVVTEGNGAGIQVIDLDSLKLVNTITTTQVPSGHTVSIEGKYLYVNGSRYKNGGITVFDLTNPVSPKFVGEYQTQYVHDCVIKNDTIYAAAIYGQGLDIIDATDKANMKRVSITNYPYSGTHNTDVTEDKKYVFTTDEINSNPNQNGNLLRVWDRTDVTNLKLVSTYVARPKTIVHNMHVKGKYGYLAHYSEGIRILDIRYPEIPVEVAHYDTYVGSVNSYVGAWGAFPYFNSNKVVISDMSGGLFVIKFPGQDGSVKAARAIVTVVDSVTNLPLSDVKVTIPGRLDTLLTDSEGKVKFGSVNSSVTATFSKSTYSTGYITVLREIVMQYDTVVTYTVKMKQSLSGSLTCVVTDKVTSKPVKNLKLRVLGTPITGLTDSSGKFTVPALLGGNTFSILAAQWGYVPDTIDVNIVGGVENTLPIPLTPSGLDNFELDLGWTVGSPNDSGSTGKWAWTTAVAAVAGTDTLQPAYDHTVNGVKYYVTGSSSSATDYVDYRTTLTSPAFNASAFPAPSILFWIYFNTRSTLKDDTLYVYLSNDNGASWHKAASISGKMPFWKQYKISINDILTATDAMRLRFVAQDGGISSILDAAIDDVEFGNNLQLAVEPERKMIPAEFLLRQNYPNPFNPTTKIDYALPADADVKLTIFDVIGREVVSLVDGIQKAGNYAAEWNGKNSGNHTVESGVYFYRLDAGTLSQTRKMIYLK